MRRLRHAQGIALLRSAGRLVGRWTPRRRGPGLGGLADVEPGPPPVPADEHAVSRPDLNWSVGAVACKPAERAPSLGRWAGTSGPSAALLDRAAVHPDLRDLLQTEARNVTRIGNGFAIRHSETNQVQLETDAQAVALFAALGPP